VPGPVAPRRCPGLVPVALPDTAHRRVGAVATGTANELGSCHLPWS